MRKQLDQQRIKDAKKNIRKGGHIFKNANEFILGKKKKYDLS